MSLVQMTTGSRLVYMINSRRKLLLCVVAVAFVLFFSPLLRENLCRNTEELHHSAETVWLQENEKHWLSLCGNTSGVEFAIVACRGKPEKNDGKIDFLRQLRQISVLLKSAAALTSQNLRFNIVADSLSTYREVTNITQTWPDDYRRRIVFGDYRELRYPSGTEKIKELFRLCATGKLFLPQIFSEKDALVFLDTDTLFLKPPEDLLCQLNKFTPKQVLGVSPSLYYYGPGFKLFPTYGTSGLNSGVLLLNLTRLRSFEGGWVEEIMKVVAKYDKKLGLGDQDILNVIFSKGRNDQVYEMGCEWNYRQKLCSQGKSRCTAAERVGVCLLHGAALTFVNNVEIKLKTVFDAWEEHQLGESLVNFAKRLEIRLDRQGSTKGCGQLNVTNAMFMKGLWHTAWLRKIQRRNQ